MTAICNLHVNISLIFLSLSVSFHITFLQILSQVAHWSLNYQSSEAWVCSRTIMFQKPGLTSIVPRVYGSRVSNVPVHPIPCQNWRRFLLAPRQRRILEVHVGPQWHCKCHHAWWEVSTIFTPLHHCYWWHSAWRLHQMREIYVPLKARVVRSSQILSQSIVIPSREMSDLWGLRNSVLLVENEKELHFLISHCQGDLLASLLHQLKSRNESPASQSLGHSNTQ